MTTVTGFAYRVAAAQPTSSGPAILLVDDERAILDGLKRQLRRSYTVTTATSGPEALEIMENETFAVVVSDMRMPGMDGATFLAQARSRYPDTVRMLLTGQADTDAAISAINDGQIFRFLTKPCHPEVLLPALEDAASLHRLVTAEKDLLEKTLRSVVQTLTATLSLAHPKAFARAVRITRTVSELAEALEVESPWEVEIAAMLAHLGAVSLPPGVLDKLDSGLPLNEDEREMADKVPSASEQLVGRIPRLEPIAEAIGCQRARFDGEGARPGTPVGEDIPLTARILRVAVDFDAAMSRRPAPQAAITHLYSDTGAYDPTVLEALARCHDVSKDVAPPVSVSFEDLQPGMVVVEEVVSDRGVILVGRGTSVTAPMLQRLENFLRHDGISGAILVQAPPRRRG